MSIEVCEQVDDDVRVLVFQIDDGDDGPHQVGVLCKFAPLLVEEVEEVLVLCVQPPRRRQAAGKESRSTAEDPIGERMLVVLPTTLQIRAHSHSTHPASANRLQSLGVCSSSGC